MTATVDSFQLYPNPGGDYSGTPYPFGMDPVRTGTSVIMTVILTINVTV